MQTPLPTKIESQRLQRVRGGFGEAWKGRFSLKTVLCVYRTFWTFLSGPFQLNIINQKQPGENRVSFLVIFGQRKTYMRESAQFLDVSLVSLLALFGAYIAPLHAQLPQK
jgi:hypothetical protein